MIISTENRLLVPEVTNVRNHLRSRAKEFILSKEIRPPVALEHLQNLAIELLQQLDLSVEYLDFAMVLCGNATWHHVVAATPYNRRLLLLPQCLRSNNSCQGTFDDLGLMCAGCRKCQMDEIINEAEKLGYTTLIAEGTTMAVSLVEEGSIDAVIGVSCMSVLQRSFEPVSRSAVPVIGIPLLFDGCENTKVDKEWVLDEIHRFEPDAHLQPLSVSLLKGPATNSSTDVSIDAFFPEQNETAKLAQKMLSMGGQRIRPLLALLAYRSYAKSVDAEIQNAIAVIIECFHKASLIHDDIEDDDDFRYEQQTLHKSSGIAVAINVGDYLIGKGYHLLSKLEVSAEVLIHSLRVVSASHVNLSTGQGADLLQQENSTSITVEQQLQIFRLKTGEAVKVALLLGAINGEATPNEIITLEKFADYFGIAYQIKDDIEEFRNQTETNKPSDYPFLIALFQEEQNGKEKGFYTELKNEATFSGIHQKLFETKMDSKADDILKIYIAKCYHQLDKLDNLRMKLSLYGVMGKIF